MSRQSTSLVTCLHPPLGILGVLAVQHYGVEHANHLASWPTFCFVFAGPGDSPQVLCDDVRYFWRNPLVVFFGRWYTARWVIRPASFDVNRGFCYLTEEAFAHLK